MHTELFRLSSHRPQKRAKKRFPPLQSLLCLSNSSISVNPRRCRTTLPDSWTRNPLPTTPPLPVLSRRSLSAAFSVFFSYFNCSVGELERYIDHFVMAYRCSVISSSEATHLKIVSILLLFVCSFLPFLCYSFQFLCNVSEQQFFD